MLLAKARERGGTERVWMKSAIVERELGNTAEERSLLDEGLKKYPAFLISLDLFMIPCMLLGKEN